jgi:Questin oxidase-like
MVDPLDALATAPTTVAPDPEFGRVLLDRVDDELRRPPGAAAAPAPDGIAPIAIDDEVLDEALEILRGTAPEFDPFGRGFCIANHAPMTADALCELGRADAVIERTARYRKYLTDSPRPWNPIDADGWREALGDYDRLGDWVVFFERELAEDAWVEVLDRWVPRLAAGSYGSGTHTVLRAAHATRSLGRRHTALRLHELAEGLAFWAARYETLPETIGPARALRPSAALPQIEQLADDDRRGWLFFTEPLDKLATLDSFAGATDLVDTSGDPWSFLDDLTDAYARLLASNASLVFPRALVHGLTAGTATRMLAPWLSPQATEIALRYGWQLAAAFYAGLVLEPPIEACDASDITREDLVEEALACGDEHAIKTLEVCLAAHRRRPDPVYLVAARATTRALVRTGLSLA